MILRLLKPDSGSLAYVVASATLLYSVRSRVRAQVSLFRSAPHDIPFQGILELYAGVYFVSQFAR